MRASIRQVVAAACGLCLALSTATTAAHGTAVTDERLSVSRSDTLPLALVSPEATWKSMRYWKIRPSNMLVYRLEWIKNMRWSRWNSRRATGTGTYWVGTCNPTCAEGAFRKKGSVKVTLSAPSRGRYRRLLIQYEYNGQASTYHLQHVSYWNWS